MKQQSLMDDRMGPDTSRNSPNWEARLARSLVRSAHRTKARVVVVGLIAAAWLILTTTGSYLAANESGIGHRMGDAIYNALTFLGPRDSYGGVGRYPTLPPLLWWGRFFGVALSMLAIIWTALYRSRGMLAAFLIRARARGHVVIISSGGFADAIARESAEEGHCVVLIERGVPNERIIDLGRAGVVVMPDEASLPLSLAGCRVSEAMSVISWAASDSVSLSHAFATRSMIRRPLAEIVVRLDSAEMQRSLRSAPELLQTEEGRLRPISPTVASIRSALRGPDLVRGAIAQQRERVHVALHGDTPALGIAASFILGHNWSIHLGAPIVSWNAGADARAWRDWSKHNYCFLEHAEAVFGEDEPPRISAVTGAHAIAGLPISAHIVDQGDDDRTLAAAFDLASRLAQESPHPAPVQAVLRNAHAVRELLQHSRTLAFAEPILIGLEPSFDALAARTHEAIEARIHRAYVKRHGKGAVAARDWLTLGETYVHANRAASDHGAVKEFDIRTADERGMDRLSLAGALARMEHFRWAVERLLDGWAPATTRNNDRRLHDKLIPWADLSDEDREKDMIAVRLVLEGHASPARFVGTAPPPADGGSQLKSAAVLRGR